MTSHKTNFSFVLVYPLKIFVNMKKKTESTESFNDYRKYIIWDAVVFNLNLLRICVRVLKLTAGLSNDPKVNQ